MQETSIKQSLFEAACALHGSLAPDEVIQRALHALNRLLRTDSCAIYLKDARAEHLELVRASNTAALPVSAIVDLDDRCSPVAEAARERQMVATQGAAAEANAPAALLVAPLTAGSRFYGVVLAARGEPFDETEACDFGVFSRSFGLALANAIEHRDATRQTLIDDLTRLYNVRYLYESLDAEIRRARRYGSAVSVVFIDLDGFKSVNDMYGHRAGSYTLTEVAQLLVASVRESDFVARYGGDEFVLMLPETDSSAAMQLAERVRAAIAEHRFTGNVGAEIHLTASFGVVSYPEHAAIAEKLIELADAAMYEAKQQRKGSVQLATP
ncbi:MAG TPA: GGDEF domain-containing protein [Blastocatellia bacterium]|nr:GGDEF domain-containing protein [Blastocatellia bacterium]